MLTASQMFFFSYCALISFCVIQESLINTSNMIKQLRDEDNDGVSKLSGRLPPHPGKPGKEQHKKGINTVEVKSEQSSSPIRED
jgi:hypothetical protein